MQSKTIRALILGAYMGTLLGAASLSTGCGGYDQDDNIEPTDDSGELGSVEEAVSAVFSPNYGYGVSTALSHLACNTTNNGQTCIVPLRKNIRWCNQSPGAGGLDATTFSDFSGAVGFLAGQFPSWSFTHLADGAACDSLPEDGGTVQVKLNQAASGSLCSGGPSSDQIDAYVCVNFGDTSGALTETPSLPGTFFGGIGHTQGLAFMHADVGETTTRAGAGSKDIVLSHGFVLGLMELMGLGARTDAASSSLFTGRSILPIAVVRHVSSGELCRGASFNSSGSGNFTRSGFPCGAD